MYYDEYVIKVKSPSELFTRSDYARLIEMIDSKDTETKPLSKMINTKKHSECRYEFHLVRSDNWKYGIFVHCGMSRDNHYSGCGCPYNLDELKAMSYEEIKRKIFNFFEIEDEPNQISIFDF